jgi:hypothetical protein
MKNNKEFPVAFLNRWLASLIRCKERRLLFATTLVITPFSGLCLYLRILFQRNIYETGV